MKLRQTKWILTICSVILASSLCLGACGSEPETGDTSITNSEATGTMEETTVSETEPAATAEANNGITDIDENSFAGEWHRTDCHSASYGKIEISNISEEGFYFTGFLCWFANSGEIEGEAVFKNENTAVFTLDVDPDTDSDAQPAQISFVLYDNILHVKSEGSTERFGMGQNVYVDGDYTLDEPVYTNANILKETFTDDELSDIKNMMGEGDYQEHFVNDTEAGAVFVSEVVLDDGRNAKSVECIVPGLGMYMGYGLLITDDGMIYLEHENDSFYTNDPSYKEEQLPTFSADS